MVTAGKRGKRTLTWLLAGLIALTLLGGLAFYRPFEADTHASSLTAATQAQPQVAPTLPPPTPLPVKRTTFLVMGVDRRPDDSGRADTMMVVAYDPKEQQLSALSLPRDLWVSIPGHGYDKLNHSYAFGGEKLAMATVQGLLDIPIDHYVTVTFQDFAKIVDAVGGIEIDVEARMEYEDPSDTSMGPDGLVIDIEPGLQQMDGLTALKYSRFRADDQGDMGRVRRQQQVVKALMKAAARPAVLTRTPQLISALGDAIDTSLSVADMVKLGVGGRDAVTRPLKTGTFAGEDRHIGGIFYLTPDLVSQRTIAYETLVGAKPPESYMKKARDDQAVYAKALAEALEQDQLAAEEESRRTTAATQPAAEPSPAADPKPPVAAPKPAAKPQPVTVAVIDASGGQVAQQYVQKLRAAGYRVARVSKASQPVKRTVVIDHAGQPGTQERIKAVLPTALLVLRPDKKAPEALEIVLGQDLVTKR